jgi:hypothetical protein
LLRGRAGASADFISQFIGLILALLLVLVPWASINLIDFYVIKRGCYDIASIFRADGGVYGRFNLHAIVAYFIGIIVQLPFANTSLYVGPYANLVEGADLSWLVGLVVTCPLYYCLATRGQVRQRGGAVWFYRLIVDWRCLSGMPGFWPGIFVLVIREYRQPGADLLFVFEYLPIPAVTATYGFARWRVSFKSQRGGLTADLIFADTANPVEPACWRWTSTITRPV